MKIKTVFLVHSRFVVSKVEKTDLNKSTQMYWYFSFFTMKTYIIVASHLNEYPQHMFWWSNKKLIIWIPLLLICNE